MTCFSHSKWTLGLMAGVASLAAALPARSQSADPDGAVVEELVVTARRRAETLNDVPISLTVQTGEQLEQRGAPDITSLQRVTPNLTLQVSRGTNSTLTAFIRGVGQQDPLWGFEPGVGLYIDDVYVARPQGAVLDIYDVERIEVLRGPQGTLYGRNTIGGAIKYVTKRLDTSKPQLRARAALGSYQQRDFILSGSLPLGQRAAVGAAIAKYDRDGYGKNLFTGAGTYNKDVISGRLSLEMHPTEDLFLSLSGDYMEDDSNTNHGHRERPIPAALAGLVNPPACRAVLESRYDTCAGLGDANEVITKGASLLAEWSPEGSFTFKSITAYREGVTHGTGIDFDNTPARILDVAVADTIYRDDQFSQELQLLYEGKRLQGVAGVYYLDASASGQFDTILQAANLTQGTTGSVDTKSFAVFADFSYSLNERLSISVGGRWTRDKKNALVFKANYLGLGSPITGRAAAPFQTLTNYGASKTFEEFTPRLSLTYELTPDVNAYAAYGRGFKSGGFDMRGDATATPATRDGYDPEIVDSYEAGLKGALFDRRLRFTSAAFYTKYKGQQITTQRVNPAGTGVVSFVDNVGSSTIYGAELEAQAQLTERFSASLALGYTKAKFDEFLSYVPNAAPPPTFVLADVADQRQFQNTPKWTGNLSLAYEHPLGDAGRLQLLGSMSFRSDSSMFETPFPQVDQPAYELYDLNLVYTSADERWRVGLHGRNLTNKRYRTGAYTFAFDPAAPATLVFGDSVIGFYGPPRTVTLTLDHRF
ncbi:TonB-dependent receptor [Phenylobacterium sp. LjRoot225]|uniref:TonB-dependent receptor n=1 Tax=Phenylobacterium sp. LjRoot225 TaxID=3342285 RepID=UPI003ECF30B4